MYFRHCQLDYSCTSCCILKFLARMAIGYPWLPGGCCGGVKVSDVCFFSRSFSVFWMNGWVFNRVKCLSSRGRGPHSHRIPTLQAVETKSFDHCSPLLDSLCQSYSGRVLSYSVGTPLTLTTSQDGSADPLFAGGGT